MSFLSREFVIFFALLLMIMCFVKKKQSQHIVLLSASYVFYALGDYRFLFLLIGVSILMWYLAKKLSEDTRNRKMYLVLGVGIDLAILFSFKYFNFFTEGFSSLLGVKWNVQKILLPVGISFYIFQSISYIADVYCGKVRAEKSIVKVLLYIGFFPQIVSGPIVKAHDFFPQLDMEHRFTKESVSWGIQKIVVGLFKKLVIADRLSVCVNSVYQAPNAYSGLTLILTAIAYSMEIYYDFAGYSDMAIGVAKILGYDLGVNFNLPYLASNPSDFWGRWHISLSSWFREYVYIPLGGNRRGEGRTYLNVFVTMLLSGLWHGANWAFVIWGACHALLSVIHKLFRDKLAISVPSGKKAVSIWGTVLSSLVMFILTTVLWIPFRVNDMSYVKIIIRRILTMADGIDYYYVFTPIFLLVMLLVEIIALIHNKGNDIWKPLDLRRFCSKVIFLVMILLIIIFAYLGNSAFIYANF